MATTVLVPDDYGMQVLSALEGVRAVRYEPGGPVPPGGEDAEILVPGFLSRSTAAPITTQLPKLRLVQLLTAGAESWTAHIPEGVMLSTARGAHGASTAEWVLTGLLGVYREFTEFAVAQRDHRWTQHQTDTLHGKRILIVGAGDLGAEVRRKLAAFDSPATLVGTRAREGVRGVNELPELLGDADAVVLTVPVTSQTIGMVDAAFLARMADGAILVNAARGPIVRTDALLAELTAGRLRAVLDVTDPEPLPPDHPLWDAPGLLLTPHVGGSSRGSRERAYAVVAQEITRYLAGETPKNLVHGEY